MSLVKCTRVLLGKSRGALESTGTEDIALCCAGGSSDAVHFVAVQVEFVVSGEGAVLADVKHGQSNFPQSLRFVLSPALFSQPIYRRDGSINVANPRCYTCVGLVSIAAQALGCGL